MAGVSVVAKTTPDVPRQASDDPRADRTCADGGGSLIAATRDDGACRAVQSGQGGGFAEITLSRPSFKRWRQLMDRCPAP